MDFLWPWSWLLLIPWAGLWWLMRKAASGTIAVPFIPLWANLSATGPSTGKRRRPPLALILIWLSLLMAILAATRPALVLMGVGWGEMDKPIAIILDRGITNSTRIAPDQWACQQQLHDVSSSIQAIFGRLRPVDLIQIPVSTQRIQASGLTIQGISPTAANTQDQLLAATIAALSSQQYEAVIVLTHQGLPNSVATAAKTQSSITKTPIAFVPSSEPIRSVGITQLVPRRDPAGQLQAMVRIGRLEIGQPIPAKPLNPSPATTTAPSFLTIPPNIPPSPRDVIPDNPLLPEIRGILHLTADANDQTTPFTLLPNQTSIDLFVSIPNPTDSIATGLPIHIQPVKAQLTSIHGISDNLPWDDAAYVMSTSSQPSLVIQGDLPSAVQRVIAIYQKYHPATVLTPRIIITADPQSLEPTQPGILIQTPPVSLPSLTPAPTTTPSGLVDAPATAPSAPHQQAVQSRLAVDFSAESIAILTQMAQANLPPPPAGYQPLLTCNHQVLIAESTTSPNRLWICIDQQRLATQPDYVILWTRLFERIIGPVEQWSQQPQATLPANVHLLQADVEPQSKTYNPTPDGPGLIPGFYQTPDRQRIAISPQFTTAPPGELWIHRNADLLDHALSAADQWTDWQQVCIQSQIPPVPRPSIRIHLHVPLAFASLGLALFGAVLWPGRSLTLPAERRTVKD